MNINWIKPRYIGDDQSSGPSSPVIGSYDNAVLIGFYNPLRYKIYIILNGWQSFIQIQDSHHILKRIKGPMFTSRKHIYSNQIEKELLQFIKTFIDEYKNLAIEYLNKLEPHKESNMNPLLNKLSKELAKIAEELSPLQKEYQDYFSELLDKHDLNGISGEEKGKLRAFFDDVSKGWEKGKGAK